MGNIPGFAASRMWIALGIALAVAALATWLSGLPSGSATPALLETTRVPSADPNLTIGSRVRWSFRVQTPWGMPPFAVNWLVRPDGVQTLSSATFERHRCGFGVTEWTCTLLLQPYRAGSTGEGRVEILFRSRKANRQPAPLVVELPAMRIAPIPTPDRNLVLAELASPASVEAVSADTRHTRPLLLLGVPAVVVGILAAWLLGRRKGNRTEREP